MVTARVWQRSPGMAWFTSLVHLAAGAILVAVGVMQLLSLSSGISGAIFAGVGGVVLLLGTQFLLAGVKSIFAQRPLGLAARNRACDSCAQCGYELSGMPEDEGTCPECGAKYVKSVEPWSRLQRQVEGHLAARGRVKAIDHEQRR